MPAFVEHALDSKSVLEIAARKAGSTRAKGLEGMTISMLLGEDGGQKEELERLVDWLVDEAKPDVVHLSNALLLGLAHRIKQRMNVAMVCSLQDEDVWVDANGRSFSQRSLGFDERTWERCGCLYSGQQLFCFGNPSAHDNS